MEVPEKGFVTRPVCWGGRIRLADSEQTIRGKKRCSESGLLVTTSRDHSLFVIRLRFNL